MSDSIRLGSRVTGKYYDVPFTGVLTGVDSGYYVDIFPITINGTVRTSLFLRPDQWAECEVKDLGVELKQEDLISAPGTIANGALRTDVAARVLATLADAPAEPTSTRLVGCRTCYGTEFPMNMMGGQCRSCRLRSRR